MSETTVLFCKRSNAISLSSSGAGAASSVVVVVSEVTGSVISVTEVVVEGLVSMGLPKIPVLLSAKIPIAAAAHTPPTAGIHFIKRLFFCGLFTGASA